MKVLLALFGVLLLAACQKEQITINDHASDTFYIDNANAAMRVLVEGNTASNVFLLFVHGGPGGSAYGYNTDYVRQHIENKYACVYWDQRNAGASQGNANVNNLNLTQMTEDLKKVIQVIKGRYGQDARVFILGHSFGGLLTASFMTTGTYQSMVKGWIVADGAHNYPLNDSLTRQLLLTTGQQQLLLGKHTADWQPIVAYCQAHSGNFTFEESTQLNTCAHHAETYFEEVKKVDVLGIARHDAIQYDLPITSFAINNLFSDNAPFNQQLAKTEFTSVLSRVTTPTLLLYSKYDFICPIGLGEDILRHISTPHKRLAISASSGHNPYIQDEAFFCNEVNQFMEQYK
jgi:pimeloyl-ACP methyl ester carboxylesterase